MVKTKFIFYAVSILILSVGGLYYLINGFDPQKIESTRLMDLFYLLVFLALSSLIGLTTFGLKSRLPEYLLSHKPISSAVRQGILFGGLLTLLLALKALEMSSFWVTGPLILAVFLIEIYFQSAKPTVPKRQS